MARTTEELTADDITFLTERHLATLTTLRPDGGPHVVAIAFTFDVESGTAHIICRDGGQKVRNIERDARVVLAQVDGRRWLALEGTATPQRDAVDIAAAVAAFESRYRPTTDNPERIAIEIVIDRILGSG